MKILKLIAIMLIVVLSALSCKPDYGIDDTGPLSNQPARVQTTTLVPVEDPIPVTASGTISKKSTVHLSFKTGGFVQSLRKNEGDHFAKDDTLASLDLSEIDARVEKAKQVFDKSERDLNRGRRLLSDSAATSEQLEDLVTAFEVAKADYQIARFNKKHSVITAPSDGKILQRLTESGELKEPGQPIYKVGMGQVIVELGVSDRDAISMALGDSAEVRLDAYRNKEFDARITEIAEEADPATGTFTVELTIGSGDELLKSGMIARATLYPSRPAPYFRVPMNAMVEANGEFARVFIAENRQARLISLPYETILEDAFTVPAGKISGPDLEIITVGAHQLRDWNSIEIVQNAKISVRKSQ
mgnify:CR=1 FL=1